MGTEAPWNCSQADPYGILEDTVKKKSPIEESSSIQPKYQWPDRNARGTNLATKFKDLTRCPNYHQDMTWDLERHDLLNHKRGRPLNTGR